MVRKDIKTTQPRRDIKTALVSDPNNSDGQQPDLNIEQQAPQAPLKERIIDFIKENRLKIAITTGSLLILICIVWVLFWYFAGGGMRQINGVALEKYSNSDYSIMVPAGYEKTENDLASSGREIIFASKKTSGDKISRVYVLVGQLTETCKKECLKGIDTNYSNDVIEKSNKSGGYNNMANIRLDKNNIDGMSARLVSYDEISKGAQIGKYRMAMIISDSKLYEIIISVNESDPGLAVSVDKIIDSFDAK